MIAFATFLGCRAADPAAVHTTPPLGESTATVDTAVPPPDTGQTDDTAAPIDCAALPLDPLNIVELTEARGRHGLAFDPDGNLIGWNDAALVKVARDGTFAPWVPMPEVEQFDWLPNGDLAVSLADAGSIVRLTPDGGQSLIAGDINAYGLVVGPDGRIWTANNSRIHRIDPDTGETEILIPPHDGFQPRVLAFSPDHTKLYMGALTGAGDMYVVDLDASFDPIGEARLFTTGVGGGYHDCLSVDECGNLYVCDYSDSALFRVSPEGQVGTFVAWNPDDRYGHASVWGTATGGWSPTALYLAQPYDGNTVVEVEIGLRSATAARRSTRGRR